MENVVKKIIVHSTGGIESDPLFDSSGRTFEQINEAHRNNPNIWLGHLSKLGYAIGYHYYISKDGTLKQGREDNEEAADCIGHNTSSLSVCLAGNFDIPGSFPTKAQTDTLTTFLRAKTAQYGLLPSDVVPHRYFCS